MESWVRTNKPAIHDLRLSTKAAVKKWLFISSQPLFLIGIKRSELYLHVLHWVIWSTREVPLPAIKSTLLTTTCMIRFFTTPLEVSMP